MTHSVINRFPQPIYGLLLACVCLSFATARGEEGNVDYLSDIKPILRSHCYACHGPDRQESDLRLDTAAAVIEGGVSGPAVIPEKETESLLIQALTGESDDISRMPPEEEGAPLTAAQISLIRRWIQQGAKTPADELPAMGTVSKTIHWSFQPIVRPAAPQVQNTEWIQNPIDHFILFELEQRSIEPSKEASRHTLIRRLTLDLLGTPPTIEQVERFVADPRPDAYDRLVDRLLASPQFGERWGRHWLDQARYADSDGYTNDVPRVMWRYRDWVIDAVNSDLAFDQFVVDQIAGDLLPDATIEQQIATGFHRNTQRNREGGSDPEQYRVESIVDRVSTTGVVFLGLTLGCARCHDHKFDPVNQREFYQLFAFLNNQDEPTLTVSLERVDQTPLEEARQQRAVAQRELTNYDAQLPTAMRKIIAIDEKKRTSQQKTELASALAKRPQPRKPIADRLAKFNKLVSDLSKQFTTSTLVMKERTELRETYIHLRGDFLRQGKLVRANVPASLPALPAEVKEPNRLDFARWLVSSENPLTPRVTVNRIWLHYFGRGLVETENDFGTQGSPPTHPELLDYLAAELIAGDWSLKQLHRSIVTSATYRQSSHARRDLTEIDPDNQLLARQTRIRLDAEIIRDSALEASGLLSRKMKGASVYPPQPDGVMKMTRNPGRKWVVSTGEDRYRRGMYTFFWRSTPHPFLKLFNAPESNTSCTIRDSSNTPLQAMTLLNDEAFIESAQALAVRVLRESPSADPDKQLVFAFQLCLARRPNEAEMAALRELLLTEQNDRQAETQQPSFAAIAWLPEGIDSKTVAAWTTVSRTLLNLDEFITRE